MYFLEMRRVGRVGSRAEAPSGMLIALYLLGLFEICQSLLSSSPLQEIKPWAFQVEIATFEGLWFRADAEKGQILKRIDVVLLQRCNKSATPEKMI